MEKSLRRNWKDGGYSKGQDTRKAIVQKAQVLFATEGYSATSMARIAEANNMTKGAVYAHFKKKRDLYIACIEESLAFFYDYIPPSPEQSPEQALHDFVAWLGASLHGNDVARAMMRQLILGDIEESLKTEVISDLMTTSFNGMRNMISALNPTLNATEFAFYIFSVLLLDRDLHHIYVMLDESSTVTHSLERTIDNMVAIIESTRLT